ncbi:hypothetical protein HZP32_14860 [Elizabethkingia anophelis]|nr:hypothetical protein [Elizabethkingia anophelis]
MNITDKVKSFEDACQLLGIKPDVPKVSLLPEKHQKAIVAHYKLIIITEALNEGWTPDWSNWNERKYYPWFEMSDSSGRFSFDGSFFQGSCSICAARLCLKTWELANYIGESFIDLYKDYFIID